MANFIISKIDLDENGVFFGSGGNDTIRPEDVNSSTFYTIMGLKGNDRIEDGVQDGILFGMEGNDTIDGQTGDDLIYGNEGNDSLFGNSGADTIYGGQGDDRIKDSAAFVDRFNVLLGNLGNDIIEGAGFLYGGQGNDVINNGYLGDVLSGDRGQDVLNGNGGNDEFVLHPTANINEIPKGTENADLITDFINGEDQIALVGISYQDLNIYEITPQEINDIFGDRAVDNNFYGVVKFLAIGYQGELLGVTGRDRSNFELREDDFITI
jgi:Ca2+-binding RTX toxin-like protein